MTFGETKITNVSWEDSEVMILHLNTERRGPVWRQTQGPVRRRAILLMMPIPRGGTRAEGGLVVAGVANQRNARAITQGDIVVGKLEENGPWTAEGAVQKVCRGGRCFVVQWKKLYGQHRTSRRQRMKVTWGSHQQAEAQGVKFAAQANTCQAQGIPEVLRGLMGGGTPAAYGRTRSRTW